MNEDEIIKQAEDAKENLERSLDDLYQELALAVLAGKDRIFLPLEEIPEENRPRALKFQEEFWRGLDEDLWGD